MNRWFPTLVRIGDHGRTGRKRYMICGNTVQERTQETTGKSDKNTSTKTTLLNPI